MSNLLLSLTQKKKIFYILPFKRNNEELKANIARIDKSKQSDVNAEISKLMSKTPPRLNKTLSPLCLKQSDVNPEVSPLVIIVILLVILGQIVQSWGLCQPLRLDLLLGNWVVLKQLMFVTIVVLQVTLVLIVSNCFLISECPIGLILCLKVLYLFLVSY